MDLDRCARFLAPALLTLKVKTMRVRVCLCLSVFLFPIAAAAQQTAAAPRLGVGGGEKPLGLPEAVEAALNNNLDVEIERLNVEIAQQAVRSAEGAFDFTLAYAPGFEDLHQPVSSVLQGGASGIVNDRNFTNDFRARQKLPSTGGEVSFRFDNTRQSTDNAFVTLSPYFQSQLLLEFSQPLLRGRTTDRERNQIRVRQKNVTLSEQAFEARVIDIVTEAQRAYWELVFARRDLEVRQESVELARAQLELNRRLVEGGSLARMELPAAEAELERRREDFLMAQEAITRAENRLKLLISNESESAWWPLEIVPAEGDAPVPPPTPLADAVQMALSRRVELRSLASQADLNELDRELQTNLTKPRVDLVASYGQIGLAGSRRAGEDPLSGLNQPLYDRINELSEGQNLPALPVPSFGDLPPGLVGNYGSALGNLFEPKYRVVRAGVEIEFTHRNRTAQAELARALIERRRLRADRERVVQQIQAEVRNALQSLQTVRQRLAAARAAVAARRERLESETFLFERGSSTTFLVQTRQNEYSAARGAEARARVDLNLAIAEYHRSTGVTLETWGINTAVETP
jgi:HAE1 family hydrophobic/amphiphilic exporter-1